LGVELFSDGFTIIDTTEPCKKYKSIEKVPASANIIYEELVYGENIERYNIMLKYTPYVVHEDSHEHVKFQKIEFELPETMPYKSF
jgi:hypothetical protein